MIRLKYFDWFTYFGSVFAGVLIAEALQDLDIEISNTPWIARLIILSILILIPLVIILRRIRAGRSIIQSGWDERINVIFAKSARNALFVTYTALFAHQLIIENTSMDSLWVLITIASGLTGYLVSYLFYDHLKG